MPKRLTAASFRFEPKAANRRRGFSLLELMIVIAVIAILVAIAYPAYDRQVIKSRRADGQAMLYQAAQRQQQFFTANNTFAGTLADLGLPAASQEGYYTLSISNASATTYTLTATRVSPQTDDSWCGDLTLDQWGGKGTVGGSLEGDAARDRCW